MKTASDLSRCQSNIEVPAQFCHELVAALGKLKTRLIAQYEQSLPGRSRVIRRAVAEAEELAWATPFPHLFFPDFAEVRVAEIFAAREPAFAHAA